MKPNHQELIDNLFAAQMKEKSLRSTAREADLEHKKAEEIVEELIIETRLANLVGMGIRINGRTAYISDKGIVLLEMLE